MNQRIRDVLIEHSDSIVETWLNVMGQNREDHYTAISEDLYELTNREFANVIFANINGDKTTRIFEEFSERVINLGWPLGYITDGLSAYRRVSIDYIISLETSQNAKVNSNIAAEIDEWVTPIIRHLVNSYTGNWENIVSLQRVALQELSAPLIPVIDQITVMPLIGTIDTERAKLIMENLLDGVIRHNAEVVLIDITGVPVVDTMVAHHIIQAAEAVRLIGSTCILVGIRPEIAQTIVNLGIDLGKFSTKSSLRKGFLAALELTDRKITDLKETEESIGKIIDSIGKE
ncbi:STAS domain-containing protein [Aciduricibacillus chroicocephali]|uniref:STAS domain-containing protein n=1 Tax=Aciduricibacillus chroicocephali TaxID=3054939 RepID=A0ABY9KWB7_9BACI|nr:STAS domain-containing protein [Bacillaceae bacterium 44XB]